VEEHKVSKHLEEHLHASRQQNVHWFDRQGIAVQAIGFLGFTFREGRQKVNRRPIAMQFRFP
jgi:hypothetical protein